MTIERLPVQLSVCQLPEIPTVAPLSPYYSLSVTDEEISLVCDTAYAPENALRREDGWRAFRICGVLDFSLIGILARISTILAEAQIGIFAVSTYNTDYILTKEDRFEDAARALENAGIAIK